MNEYVMGGAYMSFGKLVYKLGDVNMYKIPRLSVKWGMRYACSKLAKFGLLAVAPPLG